MTPRSATVMTQSKIILLAALIPLCAAAASAAEKAGEAPDIGSRRELFVEDGLIDRLSGGATLRLREPVPREISIVNDREWEGNTCNYYSVFKDGGKYRMYYRGSKVEFIDGKLEEHKHPQFYCYAESDDGIHWRKPDLGLFAFKGSTRNNIVLMSGNFDGVDVKMGDSASFFKDTNPAVPADAAYKALVRYYDREKKVNGLMAFKSPDGLRWSLMSPTPIIKDGAFDSQNVAFWDAERGHYRAYWRVSKTAPGTPRGKVRAVRTAISSDFLQWSERAELAYIDSPPEELYTNQVAPYPRAPHLFIGFPARYIERPVGASMQALPDREHRDMRSRALLRAGTAVTEGLVMASRDGVSFKRWSEAFLRPGPERDGTWNYGQQFIGWHLVETPSALPGAAAELSLYACEGHWVTPSSRLRRYTLRLDGFVSVSAPARGGELVTKPFRFQGRTLNLNFATSAIGSVQVEIQDANGIVLDGFDADACEPMFGDTVDRRVTWTGDADLGALAGKTVRLRFILSDADLYAFQFR